VTAALLLFLFAPPASFAEFSKQAAAARESNRTDDAVRLYRQCVRLKPAWAEGWWYLGSLLYDKSSYAPARDALARFVKLEPAAAPGWALLGLSELESKERKPALAHLEKSLELGLNVDPLSKVVRYNSGVLLTGSGQFERALVRFEELARLGVDNPDLMLATGLAALRVPLLPDEVAIERKPFVLEVGRVMWDVGARRAAEAKTGFEALVAKYPDTPEIHYLYGTYLLASEPDAGLKELARELDISPKHVPARIQLALEYIKRGEPAKAVPYAQDALKIEPDLFVAHVALGRALVESNDLQGGITELEIARRMAPDSPETRVALASAYARAGRPADAARERAEFLRLKNLREKPPQ
jgi:tetratricopeptide (TPR) repeat protein